MFICGVCICLGLACRLRALVNYGVCLLIIVLLFDVVLFFDWCWCYFVWLVICLWVLFTLFGFGLLITCWTVDFLVCMLFGVLAAFLVYWCLLLAYVVGFGVYLVVWWSMLVVFDFVCLGLWVVLIDCVVVLFVLVDYVSC